MSYDTPPLHPEFGGELYRGFIAEAERLESAGYTPDQVADALVALGCHLHEGAHGAAAVGHRLHGLAELFIHGHEQPITAASSPLVN